MFGLETDLEGVAPRDWDQAHSVHLVITPHNLWIHCIHFVCITYNIKKFEYMYSLAFTVFIANECLQRRTGAGCVHCFCFA